MLATTQGRLAIAQPEFKKIEIDVVGGIARAVARVELIEVPLVMSYKLDQVQLEPGDKVLLRADAGLTPWAKAVYRLNDGTMFVLCPVGDVIGYRKSDAAST